MALLSPCVLVVKTPVATRKRVAGRLAHVRPALAGQVEDAAREQDRTLAAVEEALARHGIKPLRLSVDAFHEKAGQALAAASLVISIGGDGTLLAASQWVTGALVLGVNSAPQASIGHLALARRETFAGILERIADGTLQPVPVTRLAVELEGYPGLRPALNDVLLTHASPAATSRYRLTLKDYSEEHRSSGLWISTATGSTAGIRSAGGRPMPLRSRRLQFRAREPLPRSRRTRQPRERLPPARHRAGRRKLHGAREPLPRRLAARIRLPLRSPGGLPGGPGAAAAVRGSGAVALGARFLNSYQVSEPGGRHTPSPGCEPGDREDDTNTAQGSRPGLRSGALTGSETRKHRDTRPADRYNPQRRIRKLPTSSRRTFSSAGH